LYVSNAELNMDTKLDCEVDDVEGTADMLFRGEREIDK
jgi:hypothetical protein